MRFVIGSLLLIASCGGGPLDGRWWSAQGIDNELSLSGDRFELLLRFGPTAERRTGSFELSDGVLSLHVETSNCQESVGTVISGKLTIKPQTLSWEMPPGALWVFQRRDDGWRLADHLYGAEPGCVAP